MSTFGATWHALRNVGPTRTLIAAGIFLATCLLAVSSSMVLVRSVEHGITLYVIGSAVALLAFQPFLGLIYFVLLIYVRPQQFVPGLAGLPLSLISGVGAFGSMWIRATFQKSRLAVFKAPQDFLLIWFTLAIAISPLTRLDIQGSISSVREWMVQVILYFLIIGLVTTAKRLKIVLHVVVIASLWLAIQGIVQYYTGMGIVGELDADKRIEVVGGADPNELAFHLLFVVPFLYAALSSGKSASYRFFALVAFVTVTAAIYFTNSRGGTLAYWAVMAIIFARSHGLTAGALFGALALVIVLAFGPSRVHHLSVTDPSTYGRIAMWKESLRLLQSQPLFGVGAGEFSQVSVTGKAAHNSFLSCAAELGLVGLLAWVLLIYISLKNAFYVSRRAIAAQFERLDVYAGAVAFALLAYLFAGMFLSKTYSLVLVLFVGLSAAATNIFVAKSQERYQLFTKRDLFQGVLLSMGGLILFRLFLLLV